MKRFFLFCLTGLMMVSILACGNQTNNQTNLTSESTDQTTASNNIPDAVSLLTTVWNSYQEDEKFSVIGGDFSEENQNMNGPGKYSLEDGAALDSALGFPADSVTKIDDAASLVHMMNANTFTCGAFHVADSNDLTSITTSIKENILNRQWMCGFPDKLVIVSVDDYIVSMFGDTQLIDTFKQKLTTAYSSVEVICEEPIQ
ncbi:hypothetical protein NDGK_01742 [Clostridiales bacterium CHKCI001]|nr:hypothetical protein NDGK_01742 [Clostridiales bacterium CHKCI001]